MPESLTSRLALVGVLCGVASLAGIAVALMPPVVAILLVVAAFGLFGLAAARAAILPELGTWSVADGETPLDSSLRIPRLVYYVGAGMIGLLTVRPALAFTASDWIFFAALGITGLVLLAGGGVRDYLVPRVITIGVTLFALGGLVSSFHAVAPPESVLVVIRLLYLTVIWFWLGTIVLQTRTHVENAVFAWVLSAALSSAGAVVQFFYGNVIPGGSIAWGRMTGFTPDFNNLAGLAATAFVPALMLAIDGRRRSMRLLSLGVVAFLCAGLLLCGSVGGLLAACVSTVFWLAIRGVTWKIALGLGAVATATLVLMSATGVTSSPAPFQRVSRLTSAPQGSGEAPEGTIYERLDGYRIAWSRIKEDPLIGVGLDEGSSEELLGGKLAHNILINPWVSAGILGLVGIVLIIFGALKTGLFVVRTSTAADKALTTALLASLLAFVLFAMGEPILFVRYGWFSVAMLVALRAQALRMAVRLERPVRTSYALGRVSQARA
jgi:O-antigen ligase